MTMESNQKNTLDSSAQQVANDVKSGSFSLDVDGESMTADKTVWVDGQAQNSSDTTPTTTKVNWFIWLILQIILNMVYFDFLQLVGQSRVGWKTLFFL